MKRDVTIRPPVAKLTGTAPNPLEPPSPEELYRLTHAALAEERRKNAQLSDFGRQTASIALSLLKLLLDSGYPAVERDTVTIPREIHEQMLGASIAVGQTPKGEPTVKLVERGQQRIKAA